MAQRVYPDKVPGIVAILGWDGEDFRVIKVDEDHHIQADVLSTVLPTDAATQTTLAALLTELGAKLETADLNIEAVSKDLQVDVVSSALPTDAATQTTLAALLTELGAKLETADLNIEAVSKDLQVDVVSSALPSGAATETSLDEVMDRLGDETSPATGSVNKRLETLLTALQDITDYRYQGDHLTTFAAGLTIAQNTWGDIISETCPANKVWYLIGWSVSCETVDLLYRVLLRKAGVNTFQFYGVNGSLIFGGICFVKFTAGQSLVIRGYHSAVANTYFLANAVIIEEDA